MNLGELERLVMDVLWDSNEESHTVREVADHFPDHAYTTIMTVLTYEEGFPHRNDDGPGASLPSNRLTRGISFFADERGSDYGPRPKGGAD
jgi:hypothetical protein